MCLEHLSQAAMIRVRLWDRACSNRPGDPGTVLEDDRPYREETSEFHHVMPNPTSQSCSFSSKVRKLDMALLHAEQPLIKTTWKNWFDNSFYKRLDDNFRQIQHLLGQNHTIFERPDTSKLQDEQEFKRWVGMLL